MTRSLRQLPPAVPTYEKRDGETCNDVLRRLMGLPALPGD